MACSITEQVRVSINTLPDTGYITASGANLLTICIGSFIDLFYSFQGANMVWSVTGDTTYYTALRRRNRRLLRSKHQWLRQRYIEPHICYQLCHTRRQQWQLPAFRPILFVRTAR